jgi:hypothetical protein
MWFNIKKKKKKKLSKNEGKGNVKGDSRAGEDREIGEVSR